MCPNEAMRETVGHFWDIEVDNTQSYFLHAYTVHARTHTFINRDQNCCYIIMPEREKEKESGTRGTNQTPADTLTRFSQLSVRC